MYIYGDIPVEEDRYGIRGWEQEFSISPGIYVCVCVCV